MASLALLWRVFEYNQTITSVWSARGSQRKPPFTSPTELSPRNAAKVQQHDGMTNAIKVSVAALLTGSAVDPQPTLQ